MTIILFSSVSPGLYLVLDNCTPEPPPLAGQIYKDERDSTHLNMNRNPNPSLLNEEGRIAKEESRESESGLPLLKHDIQRYCGVPPLQKRMHQYSETAQGYVLLSGHREKEGLATAEQNSSILPQVRLYTTRFLNSIIGDKSMTSNPSNPIHLEE
ncbi:MAG: hypothetical protein HXS52_10240 [Theionarchaea archaeon]|nr:hypothetical protein [Theionarchaea archaeon]MBU7038303.1 hypothetical protein [Theionarchaea archaeon]